MSYHTSDRLIQVTKPDGGITQYTYYTALRWDSAHDAAGRDQSIPYGDDLSGA